MTPPRRGTDGEIVLALEDPARLSTRNAGTELHLVAGTELFLLIKTTAVTLYEDPSDSESPKDEGLTQSAEVAELSLARTEFRSLC